jgi:lysophospholipase L1-like esterase
MKEPMMKKSLISMLMAGGLLALGIATSHAQTEAALMGAACGTTPAPRKIEYPWMTVDRWHQMVQEDVAVADKGKVDLLFVGDSITEGWPVELLNKSFGYGSPANFGVGGDHTGNVLWRLEHGHAEKLHPKVVVLTIGVNNFFHCKASPAEVFAGVQAVVTKLRALYPKATILLNGVLPYTQSAQDPKRAEVLELNRMIATLGDEKTVVYRDYGARFLQADGDMSAEVMADFLHPTPAGYKIWSEAMGPDINKLMKR